MAPTFPASDLFPKTSKLFMSGHSPSVTGTMLPSNTYYMDVSLATKPIPPPDFSNKEAG